MEPERIKYFDLEEYVDRIILSSNILAHAEETGKEFDEYMDILSEYPDDVIKEYQISSFKRELLSSNQIEHISHMNPYKLEQEDLFFDSLQINHTRIKKIHDFSTGETNSDYRTKEVWVGVYDRNLNPIKKYWYGVEPEDIKKFMDSFIKICKRTSMSEKDNNPFIKAAIDTLLFIRIHPFSDGNGRTSRLIYEIVFTNMINKIYGTNLKTSPLHLSMSILRNQTEYNRILDSIYFDLEHDSNIEINKWFNFILNMADEQLYYLNNDNILKETLDNENRKHL